MTTYETIKSKIHCFFGKHKYVLDNRGIPSLNNDDTINYYECIHCEKFKLTFSNPYPIEVLKSALALKKNFKIRQMKRKVLVEKREKDIRLVKWSR